MKAIKKKIIYIFSALIFTMLMTINTYAADFNTSVSSAEVTQGENVTVTVKFSSDVDIGGYNMSLSYDANILEYVSGADGGGGGSLRLYNDVVLAKSETRTITFKAKAAGTTNVTIVNLGGAIDTNADDLNVKVSSGKIKVNAPVTTSSNNNLASLSIVAVRKDGSSGSVETAPKFSKDVTEYNLWLGSQFNKLSLSAKAEDAKATVAVEGTELKGGDNLTTITVTAENGEKKTYKIVTHVKIEEATTTEPATQEQPSVEEPTTVITEIPTDENKKVTIAGKSYIVVDVTEETSLPEGFEMKDIAWNGTTISGASDLSGTLTLVCLMNEETKGNEIYIYDNESNTYIPFLTYNIAQRTYVMLNVEDDFVYNGTSAEKSKELELNLLKLEGGYVDAYKLKNAENIYIVRAMNWDNKIYYYYYNSEEGSMFPCFDATGEISGNNSGQSVTVQGISGVEREAFEKRIQKRNVLLIIMGIFMVIQIITLIWVIVVLTKKKESEVPDEEAFTDENYDSWEEDKDNQVQDDAQSEEVTAEETVTEEATAEEETTGEATAEEETTGEATHEEATDEEEATEEATAEEEATEEVTDEEEVTEEEKIEEATTGEEATEEAISEIAQEEEEVKEETVETAQEKEAEEEAVETAQEEQTEAKEETKSIFDYEDDRAATPEEIDKAIDDIVSQLFK